MPQVRIDDFARNDLPDVCAKCGAPAVTRKKKQFSWHPPWIFVLILAHILVYAIVALILTKRKTLQVPLCADHKGHWLWRNVFTFGGLVALVILGVGGWFALEEARGPQKDAVLGLVCGGGVLGLIVWVVATIVLQSTAIRPQEITEDSITLKNVARDFVRACEESWLHDPDFLDRSVREHWRSPPGSESPRRYRPEDEEDPPAGGSGYQRG